MTLFCLADFILAVSAKGAGRNGRHRSGAIGHLRPKAFSACSQIRLLVNPFFVGVKHRTWVIIEKLSVQMDIYSCGGCSRRGCDSCRVSERSALDHLCPPESKSGVPTL